MPLSHINPDLFDAQSLPAGGYKWTLASRLGHMLHLAQEMFGDRDQSYTILGVEFGGEVPMVWYPWNRHHVAIRLANSAASNMSEACYQLSHESVHLLAPNGGGSANNLEEGVATFFAAHYMHKNFEKYEVTISIPSYARALNLVLPRLNADATCIRRLRAKQPSFSLITHADLAGEFPKLSSEDVDFLLSKFRRDATTSPDTVPTVLGNLHG